MRATTLVSFVLLSLGFVTARRGGGGGGGGSDDGSGSGGGGSDSGDGSGGSGGSNQCFESRVNQDAEIYLGPTYSSYYNGQLTFKYRLSKSPNGSNCISADGQEYTFTYDAVMNVGAITDSSGMLDFLFWELRAFTPWDRGYSGDNAPRREVLRLSSLGYPDIQVTYPNGTTQDHVYSREISWKTDIEPVRNSTGNVTSVDIKTDFVYTPPNDYGAPATNNWVPLEEVCTSAYDYDVSGYQSPIYYPRGRNASSGGGLLTVWLQPNATNITANITGIGSNTVKFNLLNGLFQNLIGGAQPAWPCYSSGGIVFNDPPSSWQEFSQGKTYSTHSFWNASGEFKIAFEGALNVSASKPITGYNESADYLPQWISSSSRRIKPLSTGASFLGVLISIVLLAI
ncbi:hypothetical protein ABW20_dc0102359 [Dactylellina cionopaga]|nr:hypothetical protein ABW20_dc0102359 [Dactylellina cionopaga]